MTRLAPLQQAEMTAAQREVADWFTGDLKRELHLAHLTWLRSPQLARHLLQYGHFLRHECLDFRSRELAILVTGRRCKSPVEWHLHLPDARKSGIEEPIIAALAAGERPSFERPIDEIIYDVCCELLAGFAISEATYQRAIDQLRPAGLVELIALTGYYVTMAMLIGGFGFQLPPGTRAAFED